VALLYGMANVSMALATLASRGFYTFDVMVKSGGFDRLLLRPRSTALQLVAQHLLISRTGRLIQGTAVLVWAVTALDVSWGVANSTLLVAAVLGGACLFTGIFVLQATMAFWTTESLEIVNTVTYGGLETAQYPIAIYATWFRRFFTFVIPLACMNYFPSVAITGGPDPLGTPAWVSWISPLAGFLFLAMALQVWKIGVRHYRSTGS
jgi:ABC-2 type transport system permease protein